MNIRYILLILLFLTACDTLIEDRFSMSADDDLGCTAFADGKLKAHKQLTEANGIHFSIIRRKEYWKEAYRQCMDLKQPTNYCHDTAMLELNKAIKRSVNRKTTMPQWRKNAIYQHNHDLCKETYTLEYYCANVAGGRLHRHEEEVTSVGKMLPSIRRQQTFGEFYEQCLESFGQNALPVFSDDLGNHEFYDHQYPHILEDTDYLGDEG